MSTCTTCGEPQGLPHLYSDCPPADLHACSRCAGTGGVPIGPGLVAWELEHDTCPDCNGTGERTTP